MADIHSKTLGLKSSGATVAVCLVTRGRGPTRRNFNTSRNIDDDNDNENIESKKSIVDNHSHDKKTDGENIFDNNTWTIYAANAGDARVVLGHNGVAIRMTKDHRTDDAEEVQRIEESGGFIFKGRVLGVLAVTRSIGDHCMKEYVIAKPYTSQKTITIVSHTSNGDDTTNPNADNGNEDDIEKTNNNNNVTKTSFVVIGCDGLWDVMQDQEAVDFVLNKIEEKELVKSLERSFYYSNHIDFCKIIF
jgi:serine/threonine protein phosphatase PrpC